MQKFANERQQLKFDAMLCATVFPLHGKPSSAIFPTDRIIQTTAQQMSNGIGEHTSSTFC